MTPYACKTCGEQKISCIFYYYDMIFITKNLSESFPELYKITNQLSTYSSMSLTPIFNALIVSVQVMNVVFMSTRHLIG